MLETNALEDESPESTPSECSDPLDIEVGGNPEEDEKLLVTPSPSVVEAVADAQEEELELMVEDEAISFLACTPPPPKFMLVIQELLVGIAPPPPTKPEINPPVDDEDVVVVCCEDLVEENCT